MSLSTKNERTLEEPAQTTNLGGPGSTTIEEARDNIAKDGESASYFALCGQATNDAVCDWDVKTGRLFWPQGLLSLFGYALDPADEQLGFWQKNLYPEDRARITNVIRDALVGNENHWSG